MAYLYLEPMIYVPYKISLRKRNAIILKEFYKAGLSKPMKAKELKTVTKWKANIEEVPVYDFAADMLSKEENLRISVDHLVKEQKWADAHPIRCFWWRLRAALGV